LETHDVHEAIAGIRQLPTLPAVIGRILSTAADPESSALDLGRHIAADQSLTAMLLRLVNSAYYGLYRQVDSIAEAIVMLGFLEVRNLALTATAFRTLGDPTTEFDRRQLWAHALAAALAAERCATLARLKVGGVFESALLHDIGKTVLDVLYPTAYTDVIHIAQEESRYLRDIERETFGLDHAAAGAILAEHWNLPPAVCAAISRHHDRLDATEDCPLVPLTMLANYVAYEAGLGEYSNGQPPVFPGEALIRLGLNREGVAPATSALLSQRDHVVEFAGLLAG